ncbi:hypothetical protein ACUOOS_25330, partial [Escherichia coli]
EVENLNEPETARHLAGFFRSTLQEDKGQVKKNEFARFYASESKKTCFPSSATPKTRQKASECVA